MRLVPSLWIFDVGCPSCLGCSLSPVKSFNAPRRSSASPYLTRRCPYRSKTRCNENANVNAGKEKADNTLNLSARMDTPTLSTAGVGSPSPPPLDTRLTDLLTELTGPVDPNQLNQEIEVFNIWYLVDVDDALNLFSLPPVAGVGTAPVTTITQPVTTSIQTRPVTSTRTRPVTATTTVRTTTSRPRPVTSTRTRPVTTATTTVSASRTTVPARRRAGAGTSTTTSTVTTPSTRPRVAGKQSRDPLPIHPLRLPMRMAMMRTMTDGGDYGGGWIY